MGQGAQVSSPTEEQAAVNFLDGSCLDKVSEPVPISPVQKRNGWSFVQLLDQRLLCPRLFSWTSLVDVVQARAACTCWHRLSAEQRWLELCVLNGGVVRQQRLKLWRQLTAVEDIEAGWCQKLGVQSSEDAFNALLQQPLSQSKISEIERDVHRTYPTHERFCGEEGAMGRRELSQVLQAVVVAEPNVGYCQGMNFVAATLLIHADSVQEAFWLLLALLEGYHFRYVFAPGVPLVPLRVFQFSGLVQRNLPHLWRHLREDGHSLEIFAHQCVLTLFSYSLGPDLLAHVYDVFFMLGWKAVFRIGVSLLATLEDQLLNMDLEDISHYLHQCKRHLKLGSGPVAIRTLLRFEVSSSSLEELESAFQLERFKVLLASVPVYGEQTERGMLQSVALLSAIPTVLGSCQDEVSRLSRIQSLTMKAVFIVMLVLTGCVILCCSLIADCILKLFLSQRVVNAWPRVLAMIRILALTAMATAVPVPTTKYVVKLRNGVEMPMMAAGTWQYNSSEAYSSITSALKAGFSMVDTALDYHNQDLDGVGKAIADSGRPRESIFVETKVPGCGLDSSMKNVFECYAGTKRDLETDLKLLNLSYVDLVIVHFPPISSMITRSCNNWSGGCQMVRAQWKAMTEFYVEGKARAIGVSNYCPSCYECLEAMDNLTMPMVNQVQFHLGMGTDPSGFVSYHRAKGIQLQAYSVLGNSVTHHASSEIVSGNLTTSIGKAHNKSAVQVALKWVVSQGIPAVTKSSNFDHLQQDLDLFSWNFTAQDKQLLDAHSTPKGSPSFACARGEAAEAIILEIQRLFDAFDGASARPLISPQNRSCLATMVGPLAWKRPGSWTKRVVLLTGKVGSGSVLRAQLSLLKSADLVLLVTWGGGQS
eukprot:s22_g24.t1